VNFGWVVVDASPVENITFRIWTEFQYVYLQERAPKESGWRIKGVVVNEIRNGEKKVRPP